MTTLSFALPDQSFLYNTLQRCHYIDRCEAGFMDKEGSVQLTDVVQAFFAGKPGWLRPLLSFKNIFTTLLGLPSPFAGLDEKQNWWYDARQGKLVSLPLQLFSHSAEEIVLGADEKHLSFRVSFFLEKHPSSAHKKRLSLTTMVQFNTARGRLSFLPVQPLHKMIVPALLRSAVRSLEKEINQAG